MDRYTVIVNGETVVDTHSFPHAAAAYNRCVDYGKRGDIVELCQYDWSNTLKLKILNRSIL